MEKEQCLRHELYEGNDWLDGLRVGRQDVKRELIGRLHWILDPLTEVHDLRDAGPLVARLNERKVEGYDEGPGGMGYKDGYSDGGQPKPGPEYPDGPTGKQTPSDVPR